jgi:hypothetical protein
MGNLRKPAWVRNEDIDRATGAARHRSMKLTTASIIFGSAVWWMMSKTSDSCVRHGTTWTSTSQSFSSSAAAKSFVIRRSGP